jgi:hypothetical protein
MQTQFACLHGAGVVQLRLSVEMHLQQRSGLNHMMAMHHATMAMQCLHTASAMAEATQCYVDK